MTVTTDLRVESGDTVSAEKWNKLVALVARTITGPQVIRTPTGWHIRSEQKQAAVVGLDVKLVFVHSKYTLYTTHKYDFIRCVADPELLRIGTPSEEDRIDVALPFNLRRFPWQDTGRAWFVTSNGPLLYQYTYEQATFERRYATLVDSPGTVEHQQITPRYMKSDPLLILKVPREALWIAYEDHNISHIDLNIDARQWAATNPQPTL